MGETQMPFDFELRKAEARKIESSTESLFFILSQFGDSSSYQRGACWCPRLEQTVRFLQRKFREEEHVMDKADYPDLDAHKAEHDAIVLRIQGVVDTCACGDARVYRMFTVLEEWARLHAEQHDRPLIEQLRQPAQGCFAAKETHVCESC
jgi:hemerythrin-like metal-binding protein